MRALRDFDEFVGSGTVRRRRPDPARARSLISEAEHRRTLLRELVQEIPISEENANYLLAHKSDGRTPVGWVMPSLNQFAGCWRSALLEDFVCRNNLTQHSFSHRFCALSIALLKARTTLPGRTCSLLV
jgi:hypothetical protein